MNSFEQIKLEKETKEKLDEFQKCGSREEVVRLNKLREKYGEKNPGEISFWKDVWDEYNMEYENVIPEEYIPKVAMGALGLSPNKTDEIVEIGVEFALLIEGESESSVDLEFIDDESEEAIYRLVLPEERPDLYVENPKQYAERETWNKIWGEKLGSTNTPLNEKALRSYAKNTLNIEQNTEIRAAIEIGLMSKAIRDVENGYIIASERPREYWLDVWRLSDAEMGQPTRKVEIQIGVGAKGGKSITEAKKIVSDAIETGELYSPQDAPDDHYTINDPATHEGPEINTESDTTDDDDDDDGKNGQIEDSDEGPSDSPSDQSGTAQPSQTDSPPSPTDNTEDGATAETQATTANGQTAANTNSQQATSPVDQFTSTEEECEEGEEESETTPTPDNDESKPEVIQADSNGDKSTVVVDDEDDEDHSIGKAVSAKTLGVATNKRNQTEKTAPSEEDSPERDDGDSSKESSKENTTSKTIVSSLPPIATTLNYLPTLKAGDNPLGMLADTAPNQDKDPMDSMQPDSTSSNADMWDLTMYDVFGIGENYRGKSPIDHIGESEKYFVSISPQRAYCFKREATYTPASGVLVKEGERYARHPEGSLSDWETFVYWRYLRENGIVDDKPPNKALVAYAKQNGIASKGDGISIRDGEYGEFESLDKAKLYQTLDDIEHNFNINIEWDPFGDRDNESDSSGESDDAGSSRNDRSESTTTAGEASQSQSTSAAGSASESAQRTTTTERDDQAESSAATMSSQARSESSSSSTQSGGDQSETQPTTDTDSSTTTESESTIATSDTGDSSAESTSSDTPSNKGEYENDNRRTYKESETTESGDESPVVKRASTDDSSEQTADDEDIDPIKQRHNANRKPEDELEVAVNVEAGVNLNEVMEELNSDDSYDRFETYEEPQVGEGMCNPDKEAVRQFVAGFCTLYPDKKEEVKAPKDKVLNAVTTWAKINEVELDLLGEDTYEDRRKGELKNILIEEYDIEHEQFRIDGDKTRGFRGIELSDTGKDLIDIDVE